MDVCWALPGWEGEECLCVFVLPGSSLRHTGPSTLVIKIPHQDTLQDTLKAPSPLQAVTADCTGGAGESESCSGAQEMGEFLQHTQAGEELPQGTAPRERAGYPGPQQGQSSLIQHKTENKA